MHRVSEVLSSRHPYVKEDSADNFFPGVHPHQVTRAFGNRGGEKLAALLTVEGVSRCTVPNSYLLNSQELLTPRPLTNARTHMRIITPVAHSV